MKYLSYIAVLIGIFFCMSVANAAHMEMKGKKYFYKQFETKVTKLLRVEFYKEQQKLKGKRDLLLKQLRNLPDKDTKTI